MFKKIFITLTLVLSLLPIYELNAQNSNAGFVPGNIFYSKDPFEEKDKVKIYTLVFNSDSKELSGTVSFYDKTTLLGRKNFTVEGLGVQDISIDWSVTAGDHVIFAKIEDAKFFTSEGKYQNVILAKSETEESRRTVAKKITVEEKEEPAAALDADAIKKVVVEGTPDFIAKPIIASVSAIETFREEQGTSVKTEKEEVKREIEVINKKEKAREELKEKNPEAAESEPVSHLEKPLKATKLFSLNLLSVLLNNAYAFYGTSMTVLFFIGRFILQRVF